MPNQVGLITKEAGVIYWSKLGAARISPKFWRIVAIYISVRTNIYFGPNRISNIIRLSQIVRIE